jgi:hypothetical protein
MSKPNDDNEPSDASAGSIASGIASFTLKAYLEWVSVQPDRSACIECGDACYLTQSELMAVCAGGKFLWRSGYYKCGSCAENDN